jgi:hypothetical protein
VNHHILFKFTLKVEPSVLNLNIFFKFGYSDFKGPHHSTNVQSDDTHHRTAHNSSSNEQLYFTSRSNWKTLSAHLTANVAEKCRALGINQWNGNFSKNDFRWRKASLRSSWQWPIYLVSDSFPAERTGNEAATRVTQATRLPTDGVWCKSDFFFQN